MPEPEHIKKIMPRAYPLLQQKILQNDIFTHWEEMFPKIAKKVSPVKVKDETLFVYTEDNSFKNMFKFNEWYFVSTINEKFAPVGIKLISKIKFSKYLKDPITPVAPKKRKPKIEIDNFQTELTPEEIAECKKKSSFFTEEKQRETLFELLLAYTGSQKIKLGKGWHKCKLCNLLCRPKEIFCDICTIREREKMKKAIRQMFLDAPETPFFKIQQTIGKQFPDFIKECTFETINFARMELISQKAAKVPYNDQTSADAKFLVRLIRQLPERKLTPQIIEKTLRDFRFNLANLPEYFKKLDGQKDN